MLQNLNRRLLKQWPGGGSWIWVQVGQPDHCSNEWVLWLTDNVLSSARNALIKKVTAHEIAEKRVENMWNCKLLPDPKPGQPLCTGVQHSTWTQVRMLDEVKLAWILLDC